MGAEGECVSSYGYITVYLQSQIQVISLHFDTIPGSQVTHAALGSASTIRVCEASMI